MLHSTVSRWSMNMKIPQSPCTTAAEPQSPSHKVMVSLQLPYFSLCPLTLIMSLDATKKSLALFLHLPFTYLYILMRFPQSHLFSRLNISSTQSLFSWERYCKSLIMLIALHWTLSCMSMSLLY